MFKWGSLLFWSVLTGSAGEPGLASHEARKPEARAHHQLAYHEEEQRIHLVGGSTPAATGHKFFDDVWAWNGLSWTWVSRLPFPRSSHRVVSHPVRRSLLLFGGFAGGQSGPSGILLEWWGGHWKKIAEDEAAARNEPGACFDRRKNHLVLYGGADAEGGFTDATWVWDGASFRKDAKPGPGARLGHVFVWDPGREACLLFGGRTSEGEVLGDTWLFEEGDWRKIDVPGPPARWIHTAASDPIRNRVVVFGGQDPNDDLLGDTWSWDGEHWTQIGTDGPAPRMMGQLAADEQGVLLFGGRAAATHGDRRYEDRNDTWYLRRGTWTRVD